MSGISFMGVGSGLPVKEIIDATIKAESAPLKRLENDKKFYQSQISGIGQLKSRLSDLQDAMKKLQGMQNFQHLAANSSNDKLFTVTADHKLGATNGNYNVEVLAEARNYRAVMNSVNTASFQGSGNLEFTLDGTTQTLDINGKSLDQIREDINNNADLKDKVSANIVNEGNGQARLVFNAVETGDQGRFSVTNTGAGANLNLDTALSSADLDPSVKTTSLDARIKVDGIEATSSTNKFENLITGVTVNVTAGAMNETSTTGNFKVSRDDKEIKDNINAFVKSYNDVIIHINEAKKSSLYGDNTIRSIESQMREMLYQPTVSTKGKDDEDTQKNFLNMIGIEIYASTNFDPDNPNSQNGTLKINNAKLDEVLEKDFERVAHILGATKDDNGVSGYAERFANMAKDLISGGVNNGKPYKGLLDVRTDGLNSQIKRINDRVDATNMRLELYEQRLIKQFGAADSLSANFNSTGSFLIQQLASLPGYVRN